MFSLQENDDFETRSTLVKGLLHEQGQALVHSLIHSCVFCLPTYMAVDLGEVVYEIMLLDRPVSVFLAHLSLLRLSLLRVSFWDTVMSVVRRTCGRP